MYASNYASLLNKSSPHDLTNKIKFLEETYEFILYKYLLKLISKCNNMYSCALHVMMIENYNFECRGIRLENG